MPINFHDEKNRTTYASRAADETWVGLMEKLVNVKGKRVLDIGCGGGIYTKKLADMGAAHVTGLDFSEVSLADARNYCLGYNNVDFTQGNALSTNLEAEQYDIVLERAVIHHLDDLEGNVKEIYRLLKPGGLCILQDRTPEDCFLPGNSNHIRGLFFEQFPRLKEKELKRRPTSENVMNTLQVTGFNQVNAHKLWETRKTYNNLDELRNDLMKRTGRSILHELSDQELEKLVEVILSSINKESNEIVESDCWTVWMGVK